MPRPIPRVVPNPYNSRTVNVCRAHASQAGPRRPPEQGAHPGSVALPYPDGVDVESQSGRACMRRPRHALRRHEQLVPAPGRLIRYAPPPPLLHPVRITQRTVHGKAPSHLDRGGAVTHRGRCTTGQPLTLRSALPGPRFARPRPAALLSLTALIQGEPHLLARPAGLLVRALDACAILQHPKRKARHGCGSAPHSSVHAARVC